MMKMMMMIFHLRTRCGRHRQFH